MTLQPQNTALTERKSIIASMANRFGMEAQPFEATLRATVVPENCTREQFAAFLMVAKDYDLNPFTKEIYAFPTRAGGIQPIVSIDGWMNIINSHQQMDGMEFQDILDNDNKLSAIKCTIYRKDRTHPTTVIEYMSECKRSTDTWKQYPVRMLRHKAAIQCARYAFGFSGIVDPDEFERMDDAGTVTRNITPAKIVQGAGGKALPPIAGTEAVPAPIVINRDAEDVVEESAQPKQDHGNATESITPEQLIEWADRLAVADDKIRAEIWECEIEPAHEAGRIDPSDYEAMKP